MYNAVTWSLSAEMFSYAAFPFICFLIHKSRRLKTGLAIVYCSITTVAVMHASKASPDDKLRHTLFKHWFGYIFPLVRLAEFVVGKCSFFWYRKLKVCFSDARNSTVFSAVFEVVPLGIALASVVAAITLKVTPWVRYSLWYLPALVCIIVGYAQNGPIATTILSHPWLVFHGETSFAFYLFHYMCLSLIVTHVHASIYALVALAYAASSVVAYIAFRCVETPGRKKIRDVLTCFNAAAQPQPGAKHDKTLLEVSVS